MNIMFVVTGLLTIVGGIGFMQFYKRQPLLALAFGLQVAGGLGSIIVGIVPENTGSLWHGIGALLPFVGGNLGLVILGAAAVNWKPAVRWFTTLSGTVGLVALAFFVSREYLGLGVGGMERIVDGARILWLIVFGALTLRASRFVKR
jgi:hypothetical protein